MDKALPYNRTHTIVKMLYLLVCLALLATETIAARVTRPFYATAGRSRGAENRKSARSRRRLDEEKDHGKGKGKGKGKKYTEDEGEQSFVLTTAPPTQSSAPSSSFSPSSSPSVSLQPSTTTMPSSTPTVSLIPTTSSQPSIEPSSTPTVAPSLSTNPSAAPFPSPSSSPSKSPTPSLSLQPSENPTLSAAPTTSTFIENRQAQSVDYSCINEEGIDNYDPVLTKEMHFELRVCFDGNPPDKTKFVEESVTRELAKAVLECDYNDDLEVKEIFLDFTDIGDFTDGDSCSPLDFSLDVTYLELSQRRLTTVDIATIPPIDQKIFLALDAILKNIGPDNRVNCIKDAADSPCIQIETSDVSGLADGNVADRSAGSSSRKPVIPVLVVVCAVMLVVVIAIIAVQRRRERNKNLAISHVLLKEELEDEATQGSKSSMNSAAILRDLEPADRFDDEVGTQSDSVGMSTVPYPQVYVMGENDAQTVDDAEELRFTSGAYWVGSQSVAPGPTFVTTDLKKAMRDLEPPPPTPKHPRGYVHEDTVDL